MHGKNYNYGKLQNATNCIIVHRNSSLIPFLRQTLLVYFVVNEPFSHNCDDAFNSHQHRKYSTMFYICIFFYVSIFYSNARVFLMQRLYGMDSKFDIVLSKKILLF